MNAPTHNVLAMKWGTRYGSHYVNRLHAMMRRHLSKPFRFVCLTDDSHGLDPEIEPRPIPDLGLPKSAYRWAWPKLGVFHENLSDLHGACLFFDLDVVVVASIDCLFEHQPGQFCIIHDWVQPHRRVLAARPNIGNSSVFRFQAGTMTAVVDQFVADRDRILASYRNEQRYLSQFLGAKMVWWPKDWVVSFKRHCIPTFPLNLMHAPSVPPGARVVAFHGEPKPDQAEHGHRHGVRRRTKPAKWITEQWTTE